jgi:hypothetical protein
VASEITYVVNRLADLFEVAHAGRCPALSLYGAPMLSGFLGVTLGHEGILLPSCVRDGLSPIWRDVH